MWSSAMRIICAAAGLFVLTAAAESGGGTAAAIAAAGVLLGGTLLAAATRRSTGAEAETDEMRRVRTAALFCFSVAVGLRVFGLVAPRRHSDLVESATSLSAALWTVAMLLTFVFAVHAVRRRELLRLP